MDVVAIFNAKSVDTSIAAGGVLGFRRCLSFNDMYDRDGRISKNR